MSMVLASSYLCSILVVKISFCLMMLVSKNYRGKAYICFLCNFNFLFIPFLSELLRTTHMFLSYFELTVNLAESRKQ